RIAQLRVVKIAETRFVLPDDLASPWAAWETDAVDDASALVEFAGRACYESWSRPNAATRSNRAYIGHILNQKHFSVLVHAGCAARGLAAPHVVVVVCPRAWRECVRKRGGRYADAEMREVVTTIFREVGQPLAPAIYRDFRLRTVALDPAATVEVLEQGPALL